jgi:hypothetical protein
MDDGRFPYIQLHYYPQDEEKVVMSFVSERNSVFGRFATKARKRDIRQSVQDQEEILLRVQRSPRASDRRTARQMHTSRMQVGRTVHQEGLYPYYCQRVQVLQPEDYAAPVHFCRRLVKQILFCVEAQFTLDGITSCRNTHVWSLNICTIPLQANSNIDFGEHACYCFIFILISLLSIRCSTPLHLILALIQITSDLLSFQATTSSPDCACSISNLIIKQL